MITHSFRPRSSGLRASICACLHVFSPVFLLLIFAASVAMRSNPGWRDRSLLTDNTFMWSVQCFSAATCPQIKKPECRLIAVAGLRRPRWERKGSLLTDPRHAGSIPGSSALGLGRGDPEITLHAVVGLGRPEGDGASMLVAHPELCLSYVCFL